MLEYEVKVSNYLWMTKERVKDAVHSFFTDEEGDTNFISIIVVLVIVLGLAVVFRKNIAQLANSMWTKIFTDATDATKTNPNQTQFTE